MMAHNSQCCVVIDFAIVVLSFQQGILLSPSLFGFGLNVEVDVIARLVLCADVKNGVVINLVIVALYNNSIAAAIPYNIIMHR